MLEEILELYKTKLADTEKDLIGYQSMIQLVTTIEEISQEGLSAQSKVVLLKKLEDQVNRQSKELRDLKVELEAAKRISPPVRKRKGKALDGHAWNLIDLLSKEQGSYTTNELEEMLGLSKVTVINVMKRAVALDPDHLKLTRGKRRELNLAYVP
jgi:predicted transcriptional regulator